MRIFVVSIFVLCLAGPSFAEWRTTKAHPVEKLSNDYLQVVEDFFYETDGLDDAQSKLTLPLTVIFDEFSSDLKKLALAKFPEPLVNPYLETPAGEVFIPVFSENLFDEDGNPDGGGEYSCQNETISISRTSSNFSPKIIHDQWDQGRSAFGPVKDRVLVFLAHEIIHAIQAKAGWMCTGFGPASDWYTEGTADGIAHYLLSHRNPSALKSYRWARNERFYSNPLVSNDGHNEYDSGSFFRYLFEATETNGKMNLSLARDLTTNMDKDAIGSRQSRLGVLKELDRIVRKYNGGRPLALTLAEFFTEYASYGGKQGRYGLDLRKWYYHAFEDCSEFELTPGATATLRLLISENAAHCIRVNWKSFEQPASLQIYTEGKSTHDGALHMGQSHVGPSDENLEACYDVTSFIDSRIAAIASWKCMLRRSATKFSSDGTEQAVDGWTSDHNLVGDGFTYLILTNASENLVFSVPKEVNVTFGTNLVRDESGKDLPPRRDVKDPVKDGLTLMDSRVHAAVLAPGRLLFDGRSVFGDGLDVGFLDGSPGAGEVDGSATIIRTGTYNVMLLKDNAGRPDGGAIMREPDGTFLGAIITLGMKGMPEFPSCGFKVPAELTILEQTKEKLSFRVSGDVFHLSRETMSGQGEMCERLRAAHVEYKEINVSLPWSANYDGTATIERAYPPMQDIYDEREFRSGPSFGGIETSRSIVFGDKLSDDLNSEEPNQTSSPTGPTQSTSSTKLPPACTCLCPGFVHPTTEPCFGQCEPVLRQCSAPNSLADTLATNEAETNLYNDLLGLRGIPDDIRDVLTSDFSTMSLETRRQIIRESVWDQAE